MALATMLAAAQAPKPSSKGLVIKGKAPISKEVLKVKLPKAFEAKLSNGLQVIVLKQHKLPTFSMQMIVLSGGLADAVRSSTAPHNSPLRFCAREPRLAPASKSQNRLTRSAATIGANSGLSSTDSRVSASGLTDNFDQIMELFADIILNPSFPADEFNKLKTRSLAQLRQQRSQPGFLANEMFEKVMYGSHPGARVSLTAEEIQTADPGNVARLSRV